MSSTMKAQEEGRFEDISERDKEIQASIWALIFLVSEIALAFRTLRDRLNERGALLPEDEEIINQMVGNEESLRLAYQHIEGAFREKYLRVMAAMENPAEVTREVQKRYGAGEAIDPNGHPSPTAS